MAPAPSIGIGPRRVLALLLGLSALLLTWPSWAQLVINEVDYDQPGTDTAEFIEIYNPGPPVGLAGYDVHLVNGANNLSYGTIALPSVVTLATGDFYVICGNPLNVPGCDLDVSPDQDMVQNGAPDAMALRASGVVVDRVSYEGLVPGFSEGTTAPTDTASAGQSLSRCSDGSDSNDNGADFQLRAITPGAANSCPGGGTTTLGLCGDPATAIATIQGAGTTSLISGQSHVIEGVVVGDFQDSGLAGFFVQEENAQTDGNPATSEGIFVFQGALTVPVSAGNLVRVLGQVTEFQSLTELGNVTAIVVCPGAPPASPMSITLPVGAVGDLERYEGMLVDLAGPLSVTGNFELGRYGSVDLAVGGRLLQPTQLVQPGAPAVAAQADNDRRRIILDDLTNAQNPNPIPYKDADGTRRVGDTLPSLSGILSGLFGDYRVHPTGTVTFTNANPRPSAPPAVGGSLRVSAFNVLNYFTTIDTGAFVCGPSGALECRGADSALELSRQREKLLNALEELNADVLGLLEIENNPSASVADLVAGLNVRFGPGEYSFVNTGTIGTDAIKGAIVYKPAKATPFGTHAILTSAVDPAFIDTKNRPSLAQTFHETATGGRFTLVLNHLKSKGSPCTDVGDPDVGDGQGNCNLTRTAAANALLSWIGTDPTGSNDPDFLIIGDINAYAKEDPITALVAGGFHPLIAEHIGQDAYSYQFRGQTGYLDHALASGSLSSQVTGVAEWRINADEPSVIQYDLEFKTDDPFDITDPYGASDHDPVMVGLALTPTLTQPVPAMGRHHIWGIVGLMLTGAVMLARRQRRLR